MSVFEESVCGEAEGAQRLFVVDLVNGVHGVSQGGDELKKIFMLGRGGVVVKVAKDVRNALIIYFRKREQAKREESY